MKTQDLNKIHQDIIAVYEKYNVRSCEEMAASLRVMVSVIKLTQIVEIQDAKEEKESHETD